MDSLKKLITLRNYLVDSFVQRENEITAVLSSLISGEPCILVADVGTAKTQIIETTAKLINAKYFYYLLTRFTEPDELLGVIDIKALREGEYRRITTNRLPEAHIVFLDEIFKASSSIRNILLDIILNKRVLNGTQYVKLPLLTLYSASNEISTDAEDRAFYDRLTIRDFHYYVSEDAWEELIDKGLSLLQLKMNEHKINPILNVNDVKELQKIVLSRAISLKKEKSLINKYLEALSMLKTKGLELSDRRKIKVLVVASAISILYLEKRVSLDSLADSLRFVAIHDEDDIKKVEEVIMEAKLSSVAEQVAKLQAIITELENVVKMVKENPSFETLKALSKVRNKVVLELKRLPKNPRLLPYVRKILPLLSEAENIKLKYRRELFGEED